jgi:phage FluMu protein Com
MGKGKRRKKRAKGPQENPAQAPKAKKTEIPEQETPEIRQANWKTRFAIGAVLLGGTLGIGTLLSSSKKPDNIEDSISNNTQEKNNEQTTEFPVPPKYEARFEVEGLKVHLDESWKNFHPENNQSISDTIKGILEKGVPFLKKFGLKMPKEEISLSYDPKITLNKELARVNRIIDINWVPKNKSGKILFNEEDMNLYWTIREKTTPKLIIGILKPSTLIHELLHIIHGVSLSGSLLWYEGIAEALERLFEEQHPKLKTIKDLKQLNESNKILEESSLITAFTKDIRVREILTNNGCEEKHPPILGGTSSLINNLAGEEWKTFLENNQKFLGLFLAKLQRWIESIKKSKNLAPEFTIIFNHNLLSEAAGHWSVLPKKFPDWFNKKNIFKLRTSQDTNELMFFHKGGKYITCATTETMLKKAKVPGHGQIEISCPSPQQVNSKEIKGFNTIITIPEKGFTTTANPFPSIPKEPIRNSKSGKKTIIIEEE